MKLEKCISALWAFLLGFGLSAGSTMCIVTAFDMAVDTGLLLRVCALAALICSVCYTLPLSLVPTAAGAGILGYLWQLGTLEASTEAFLNRLTRQYDRAYGWGIIRWGYRVADEMEPDIVFILCVLGAAIALLCAWSVCRRKTVLPAIILSLLTFATCFVVTDTVPDTAWLFLLLLSFFVLMITGSVRRQDEKQGNRLCLLLTPVTALALLILFAAIPRDSYDRQDDAKRLSDQFLHTSVMQLLLGHVDESSAVITSEISGTDLKSVGYHMATHAPVLQVTAPYTGTLYLRSKALNTYDGVRWRDSGTDCSQLYWPDYRLQDIGEVTVTTRFAHRMLYMPYYTDLSRMQNVTVGIENEKQLTEYSFPYRALGDPEYLAKLYPAETAGQNYADQGILDQHIFLYEQTEKWAKPLAAQITGNIQSPYHKANAIAAYVRDSATYSTRTPRMPAGNEDFARWFLEESDTGYCVHFATATTVLLQAAGIPARYVTGYMTQATAGEQVTVYSDQAHAWTEYWLPRFGWTVLDATPPDSSAEAEQNTEETAGVTMPQTPTQPDSQPSATVPSKSPVPQPEKNRDWMLWALLGIAMVCATVTAAEVQRRLRLRLRRKQLDTADPNQKALLYWQRVTACAALLKETPDRALYALAEKAKFSQYTLTETDLQSFEAYLQESQERLRTHNLLRRLYYRFIFVIY